MWCCSTEEALRSESDINDALCEWLSALHDQLEELIVLIRRDLSVVQRRRIVALVTQDVHNRDTIEQLSNEKVEGVHEFTW